MLRMLVELELDNAEGLDTFRLHNALENRFAGGEFLVPADGSTEPIPGGYRRVTIEGVGAITTVAEV